MFLQSGLSFRIYCSMLLMSGICVSVTNLVHCKICMVGFRIVYSSVLFRIFPSFVSVLPLSFVSLLMKSMLPEWYSFCFSSRMCFVLSVHLFSSVPVFSLSLFCPVVSCQLLRSCIWRLAVLRPIWSRSCILFRFRIIFSKNPPVFLLLTVSPKRSLLDCGKCFFSVGSIRCINGLNL